MNERSLRALEYYKIVDLLVDRCTSQLGKDLALALKPSSENSRITKMQTETSEAQSILIQRGNVPLEGIHNITALVRTTEIGSFLDFGSLLRVKEVLNVARRMKSFIKSKNEDSNWITIEGLINTLSIFREIEDKIEKCIISEIEISDNASSTLRKIRKNIILKNEAVKNKLNKIITSQAYQKILQDTIVTLRQNRYVVPVKQEHRSSMPGVVHDKSSSGATLFIEPMAVVELNNQLRELHIEEKKEIERILMEISAMIAERGDEIKSNQIILQQLDFIFAKGKLSIQMKGVEPILSESNTLHLKNARHPLLKVDEVVPTSIWLCEGKNILVLTGPNTGGKTVALKTVGLLSLLAQSGLHLPVDFGTKLPIYDSVFADIGDEQSIEQSLSTFSSHMTNIVEILNSATEKSLVLFDELGAGTDPTEGAALAMSILTHLESKGTDVIATTHYSELKQFALVNEGIENASVEFDVETLRPTYKLLIGIPGKSNAFEISKKLGLPEFLVEDAKTLISKENIEFEDLLQNIEKNRTVVEKEKLEIQKTRLETERLKQGFIEKKSRIDEQKDEIIKKAKKEALKIVKEAKKESEEVIIELRNMKVELEEKEVNRQIEASKKKLNANIEGLHNAIGEELLKTQNNKAPVDLKPGETVKVLSLNQIGYVVEKEDEKGQVLIQVGIMKVKMDASNLKREKEEKKGAKTGISKMLDSRKANIMREIDVRGQNIEESMLEVDKFIDDCYIVGVSPVTIIHGVGTGVLGAGIKQMLKKNGHVKKYRQGKYGEGGVGVTIVELKQ
ncbi:MAG: endonuclease MutS2 [Clostridiales bacterium]|nr:endonuclease MutS2 [Clostridiales bacterium]